MSKLHLVLVMEVLVMLTIHCIGTTVPQAYIHHEMGEG